MSTKELNKVDWKILFLSVIRQKWKIIDMFEKDMNVKPESLEIDEADQKLNQAIRELKELELLLMDKLKNECFNCFTYNVILSNQDGKSTIKCNHCKIEMSYCNENELVNYWNVLIERNLTELGTMAYA